METKDTQIEGLTDAEFIERMRGFSADHEPDGWPAIRMKWITRLCDIAATIPAVKAMQEEIERLNTLVERVKLEATIHAQEARTANATIAEIYQAVTKATGEPGNWNGAKPVTDYIATLEAQLAALQTHLRCMKNEAEVALLGDERMLRDACEEISRIGLEAHPVSANQPDSGK